MAERSVGRVFGTTAEGRIGAGTVITCLVGAPFSARGERSGVAETSSLDPVFNRGVVCVAGSGPSVVSASASRYDAALGEGVVSGEATGGHASGSGPLRGPFGKVGLGSCASGGVFP